MKQNSLKPFVKMIRRIEQALQISVWIVAGRDHSQSNAACDIIFIFACDLPIACIDNAKILTSLTSCTCHLQWLLLMTTTKLVLQGIRHPPHYWLDLILVARRVIFSFLIPVPDVAVQQRICSWNIGNFHFRCT